MRVTALELFAVPPRWLFLKVSTDEGVAGWGEPIVEGRAATVAAAVGELGAVKMNATAELHYLDSDERVEAAAERVRDAAAARAPAWRSPVWRNADGTVAEW